LSENRPYRVEYTMPKTYGDKIMHIYIRAASLTLAKHLVDELPYCMWEVKSITKDSEENYRKWIESYKN